MLQSSIFSTETKKFFNSKLNKYPKIKSQKKLKDWILKPVLKTVLRISLTYDPQSIVETLGAREILGGPGPKQGGAGAPPAPPAAPPLLRIIIFRWRFLPSIISGGR